MIHFKGSLLVVFVAMAVMVTSCQDDFDLSKISSDNVEVNSSYILPVARAYTMIADLFPQQRNKIEYRPVAGTDRYCVAAASVRDSVQNYSVYELLGLNSNEGQMYYTPEVNVQELLKYAPSVTIPFQVAIDVRSGFDVKSALCDIEFNVTHKGFSQPANYVVKVGDKQVEGSMNGMEEQTDTHELKDLELSVTDNVAQVSLTISSDALDKSALGSIQIACSMKAFKSVTASVNDVQFDLKTDSVQTGLLPFARFTRIMDIKNPVVGINYSNMSSLKCDVKPDIKVVCNEKSYSFSAPGFAINSNTKRNQVKYNRSNVDFSELMHNMPEVLVLDARLTLNGASSVVTVTPADSLFVGYFYDIPLSVLINGSLDIDTLMLSTVTDQIDMLNRAKLVFDVKSKLPMNCKLKARLVNTSTNRNYSEIEVGEVLKATKIDANKVTVQGQEEVVTTEVMFSEKNVEDLKKSDAIVFMANFCSTDKDYVWITTDDFAELFFSMAAEFDEFNL